MTTRRFRRDSIRDGLKAKGRSRRKVAEDRSACRTNRRGDTAGVAAMILIVC